MNLRDLISRLNRPVIIGPQDLEVTAVSSDSRQIQAGSVFVAVRGHGEDGRAYIPKALENGAAAIVSDTVAPEGHSTQIPWIQISDTRAALGIFASALQGNPSRKLRLVGVTGTNGKTTTTFLVHHIMKTVWHRAGMVGTVSVDDGEEVTPASHTTPGPVAVQEVLARIAGHACRGAVMEVSSHGIDQQRIHSVGFDAAVFTNLTQDHLDYHGTMDAYAQVKFSWFEKMAAAPGGKKPVAVINLDDSYGEKLVEKLDERMPILTYGFGVHCHFRANNVRQTPRGMEFELTAEGKTFLVRAPLIGRFNVYNILAAIAAASAVKISIRDAVDALAQAPQVPGRMEFCGQKAGVSVFVDYAHTPDALQNACRTLKELNPSHLITIFGCGGDRDKTKRPLMARAVSEGSDFCIITSDNPRSEDPATIIREIEAGVVGSRFKSILDRSEAIHSTVTAASPGDIVLIAGKGHETYQQFADKTLDFDDRREARRALAEREEIPPRR